MVLTSSKKIRKVKNRPVWFKALKTRRNFRKTKYLQCLYKDLRQSTIHGLAYVIKEELHWFERIFWLLAFCLNIVFMLYLVGFQVARFFESPTVMSVEMDYFNWNISYPAFTMCPAVKYDAEEFNSLVNEMNQRTGVNVETYLQSIVIANMDNLDWLDLNIPSDILKLIDPSEYTQLTAKVFKKFVNSSLTTNNNWPISFEEVMTEYGMCHVVNSNVAAFSNPNKWNQHEAYKKTNIELSVHDQGFFAQVMDYADVYKVFIHSPDEQILTSTQSYTHSLRGFISFGVTVWSTKISDDLRNAPTRLRKCRHINEATTNRYGIYTYNFCMMECRIRMILKLCGCVPHFYKPLDHEKICSLKELLCIMKKKKEILKLAASNNTLSQFRDKSDLPRNSHDCGCSSRCESEHFLKDYENFVSQTTLNRLRIVKMAGVINLCTGASLISTIELIDSFTRIPVQNIAKHIMDYILK